MTQVTVAWGRDPGGTSFCSLFNGISRMGFAKSCKMVPGQRRAPAGRRLSQGGLASAEVVLSRAPSENVSSDAFGQKEHRHI